MPEFKTFGTILTEGVGEQHHSLWQAIGSVLECKYAPTVIKVTALTQPIQLMR